MVDDLISFLTGVDTVAQEPPKPAADDILSRAPGATDRDATRLDQALFAAFCARAGVPSDASIAARGHPVTARELARPLLEASAQAREAVERFQRARTAVGDGKPDEVVLQRDL
jgi:hypothetical protein